MQGTLIKLGKGRMHMIYIQAESKHFSLKLKKQYVYMYEEKMDNAEYVPWMCTISYIKIHCSCYGFIMDYSKDDNSKKSVPQNWKKRQTNPLQDIKYFCS